MMEFEKIYISKIHLLRFILYYSSDSIYILDNKRSNDINGNINNCVTNKSLNYGMNNTIEWDKKNIIEGDKKKIKGEKKNNNIKEMK